MACVAALKSNYSVPDETIKVVVRQGWITLEGEVEWQYQRDAAHNAVRYLTGVQGVYNNIAIKTQVSPKDVKNRIVAAFHRNADIDARRINVETHDGKVILRGSVWSWGEREAAEQAAWAAPGVTTVENDIMRA